MDLDVDTYPELVANHPEARWMTPSKIRADELIDTIREHLDDPDRIADIGCGDGFFCRKLRDEFDARVIGVEKHSEAFEDSDRKGLELVQGDGTKPLEDNSADCICYINSLQAMEDPFTELRSAYESLKRKGIVMLTAPEDTVFPRKALDFSQDPPKIVTDMRYGMETYSQHFFPDGCLTERAQEIGFKALEKAEVAIDVRGLPKLYDAVKPSHRPNVDEKFIRKIRESPEESMDDLLPGDEKPPKVSLWVLSK